MRKLDRFLARRREIARRYDEAFAAPAFRSRIEPLRVPAGVTSAYHLYVVRLVRGTGESLESLAARRRLLFLGLREANIAPQVHYIPVHSQPDFQRHGLSEGSFPGAEAYYASCISLPMFPAMSDADVDYVTETLARVGGVLS